MIFIETPDFAAKFDKIASQDDMIRLQEELIENPEKGKLVKGTGGARKIRMRLQNRGKSGGARAIYYYVDFRGEVWFLQAYAKSEKSTLSATDKKRLFEFIKETIQ